MTAKSMAAKHRRWADAELLISRRVDNGPGAASIFLAMVRHPVSQPDLAANGRIPSRLEGDSAANQKYAESPFKRSFASEQWLGIKPEFCGYQRKNPRTIEWFPLSPGDGRHSFSGR